MIRTLIVGTALALGLVTAASAGVTPVLRSNVDSAIVRVAEGCGPGFWRGPGGRCHPFAAGRLCPPGYHIGPHGRR